MYVCLCKAVSDRIVRKCVREGAETIERVGRACGAGTVCGSCRDDISCIIREEKREEDESLAAK
jgi:bacterioferritin-associated ferredoxin